MVDVAKFVSQFNFKEDSFLSIGVEQEYFVINELGEIVPKAKEVYDTVSDLPFVSYELSACQFEIKTDPLPKVSLITTDLYAKRSTVEARIARIGLKLKAQTIGPASIDLSVYPDSRYQQIASKLSQEVLFAACAITSVHFHVGMRTIDELLRAYNYVSSRLEVFNDFVDHKRLELYARMKKDYIPPKDLTLETYLQNVLASSESGNPRDWWPIIRPSLHGTLEFRIFPNSENYEEITRWGELCVQLCRESLHL